MNEAVITAACARAIAAGTKTMIRQVTADPAAPYPRGVPGDSLWVRAHGDDTARQLVRIASVRVERLQDISDADLDAEGGFTHRDAFAQWWDSVHPRPGTKWDDNPYVWVVALDL